MNATRLRIVVLGLSITSSWGNGHATTYRGLLRGLLRRGHSVTFLERDKPWYAAHRDMTDPHLGDVALYDDIQSLTRLWGAAIANADLVVVGSYVPDGIEVGRLVQKLARGVTAFYDIDTPVTLASLEQGTCEYLTEELIKGYDFYLSFTGGPTLRELEDRWGARKAWSLYCAVDPDVYQSAPCHSHAWDLGYLGTFSSDRQPKLNELLSNTARSWPMGRFVLAGSLYPAELSWPGNVERVEHISPAGHRGFYMGQRFTLNVTRQDMVRRGWSPSVRLFEAAGCGTPILTDDWDGLASLFRPGAEILVVRDSKDVLEALRSLPEKQRSDIGQAARAQVLASHTSDHRAAELERYALDALHALRQRASA